MSPISTKELELYDKQDEDPNDGLLIPLSIHPEELRNKIIISLLSLTIATLIGFTFTREIIR